MNSTLVFLLCTLAAAVLAQQLTDEDPSAEKRMRSFAFAKRSPMRFAFAKRSPVDEDDEEIDEEKRALRGFAKRWPARQFAFAKRAYNRFAFAKRGGFNRFAFA
ncbi:unnamed protein product, partial [Mesorhabditis belari]|uniref:Uncharacterized protein n=1 Tax=Mesorhabditis belari TaxID=2138241 RepID=A0AAF3ES25_9BILA